jgi:hypothetical protein
MKRVASFLLVSGPLWSPPPPPRSWPPRSHLYSSPRRFPVESHHLLGCSHKIPNRASVTSKLSCHSITVPSMASGLPQHNKVASNTTLGLCSQDLSRHVLPHATPGFFARCGHRDLYSSLNFASILLAPRDDTLVLHSGGRTQDQGTEKLSNEGAMPSLLDFRSKG